MSGLEERLERLERRNLALEGSARRWRVGTLAVALLGGSAALMGQAAPRADDAAIRAASVTTREINIVDDKGKVRLEIGVDKDGAGIDVRDARGKVRLVLGEGTRDGPGEGTGLWVLDDQERPRVGLGLGKKGSGLVVLDEDGKPVAGEGKETP